MSLEPLSDDNLLVEPETVLTPKEQRRKASQLLIVLQWLLILISIAMMSWLYVSQKRFEQKVDSRLQTSEQVTSRLNEMDDKLHSISQQTMPSPSTDAAGQAQNQLDLLRLQLQAAERLLEDDRYEDSISLLRGVLWQLSQPNNEIAPALSIVLKQSLEQDIKRIQAQSSQPSAWQIHNLAIVDVQGFLRNEVGQHRALATHQMANQKSSQTPSTAPLTAKDIVLHETIMTLNLAMQAGNMRDQSLLIMYLQQAKEQLKSVQVMANDAQASQSKPSKPMTSQTERLTKANANIKANTSSPSTPPPPSVQSNLPTSTEMPGKLNTLNDAIVWLDKLIASPPAQAPLLTAQVLDNKAHQTK
ncbi:MAG: hypothetical protein Q4P13_01305 [Psychrobacter sp.]|nr:hypothetical protein [Psychrobacter sp.]